jgi:hypothetical protein
MGLWPRLILLFVAVVVAVLVLRVLPGPIVLLLFITAVAVAYRALSAATGRGSSDRPTDALGLRAVPEHPAGLGGYPLALLGRGDDGRQIDLMQGRWGALDVSLFDHAYTPSLLVEGMPSQRTFTCVLAEAPLECAHLVVEPEAFLTASPDRAAMPEVDGCGERFDRAFDVRCDDPGFARAILDETLTGWLLAQGERWGFELEGRLALLYAPKVSERDRRDALDAMRELLDLLPSEANDRLPPRASQGPASTGTPD